VAATRGKSDRPGFEISLRIDFRLQTITPARSASRGLVGTRQQIAERLRAYRAQGVDELILDFMDRDHNDVPPLPAMLYQLERFQREILPSME